ncbi:MAG: hypothetical protein KBB39_16370 [Phycicoccus sp.]|nr:hypothetical protein [Phycicoccus sp.]
MVTVSRCGDLTVVEVAIDFGLAEESVRRRMRPVDVDDGIKIAAAAALLPLMWRGLRKAGFTSN